MVTDKWFVVSVENMTVHGNRWQANHGNQSTI